MKKNSLFVLLFIFLFIGIPSKTYTTGLDQEYLHLAEKLLTQKEFGKAIICLHDALNINPENITIHTALFKISFAQNNWDKAIEHLEFIVQHQPRNISLLYRLAQCFIKKKMIIKAVEPLKKIIAITPSNITTLKLLGTIFQAQKKHKDALWHLRIALTSSPGNQEIIRSICKSLIAIEQFDEALDMFERIIDCNPNDIKALFDIAKIHNFQKNFSEAAACYEKILEIKPTLKSARYNYAYTLKKLGYTAEAIKNLENFLIDYPQNARAHFGLATAYLSLGDFQQGWPEYEWRWQSYNELPPQYSQPMWDGLSDLHGKTILVTTEQGLGDTFQFIRYIQLLKDQGATIIVQTQKATTDIVAQCDYVDIVIPRGKSLPPFDLHIPLMSLPLLFKTTVNTVPKTIPYLFAQESLIKYWQEKLSPDTNFKIGICWNGNPTYRSQALKHSLSARSIPLKELAPLAKIPGVSLYSLQKTTGEDQLKKTNNLFKVHTFDQNFDVTNGRFMDTAAVIKNMDLIITIDTSIAHLAGGLGIPTWIMLPNPADWRWIIGKDTTPWYPKTKLFKQPTPGNWSPVIKQIAQKLTPIIKGVDNETIKKLENFKKQLSIVNKVLIKHQQERKVAIKRFNQSMILKKNIEQRIKELEHKY
ncbi:tetratricopeptide repeat protein [bacterium]|nr:tetratricopeptide repeat protein [bacterium]